MLKLLIVRHGNTFDKGEIIRRVGLKTDLPLSQSGIEQCAPLAKYLKNNHPTIDHVFCSELQRTKQTAKLILPHQPNIFSKMTILKELNEIDYGIDDGKPEQEVISRLGTAAIENWELNSIVPNGWLFDPKTRQKEINKKLEQFVAKYQNQTLLLVTSNGIARFFASILSKPLCIQKATPLKVATASISELTFDIHNKWQCTHWGLKTTQ